MFSKEMKKCEQVISFMSAKLNSLVAELEGKQQAIDECPAETPTERVWLSGAMGSADLVRDEIAYFNGRLEQLRTKLNDLQALDINGQIDFNEAVAFSLSKKLNLAVRHGASTSGIDAELDEVLNELQQQYRTRDEQQRINELQRPEVQREIRTNIVKTIAAIEGRKMEKGKKRRYVAEGEKRNAQPQQQPRKGKDNQQRGKKRNRAA